jgi:hypothetical protein
MMDRHRSYYGKDFKELRRFKGMHFVKQHKMFSPTHVSFVGLSFSFQIFQ